MRHLIFVLLGLFFAISAKAENAYEPLLNTVTLQLNADQWVATQSALVTVGVNATVNSGGLEKTQNTIMSKLNQISNKGVWHVVSFNRSLNQSGLEQVQISAQARIPSADLSGIRDRAKALTHPGEAYTIDNVEFVPSEAELRDANTNLRTLIYQQAKNELATLAKFYPDQKYSIHSIDFVGPPTVQPQPMMAYAKMVNGANNNVSVQNKLIVSATVILAAAPNSDVTKIVHV